MAASASETHAKHSELQWQDHQSPKLQQFLCDDELPKDLHTQFCYHQAEEFCSTINGQKTKQHVKLGTPGLSNWQ